MPGGETNRSLSTTMKQSKHSAASHAKPVVAPTSVRWPLSAVFALIAGVTLVAYWPALNGDFLWDDAGHVTSSALQSWSGLWRIWFEVGATQQYYPLLHTVFWIEHGIWGDSTIGYHVINVLEHAAAATLLVALLRRLEIPGAVLAALVFALHPVGVESVAWISEQKNTLSTVFYLAAALAWLRFEDERRPAQYVVATLWFLAALLTKTVTATLPAALLVVAWWRRGEVSWRRDVVPLLPWLVLGVAAGLGTAWIESTQIGAGSDGLTLGVVERGLVAGRVVWFYLGKLLWPVRLAFFYPHWTIDALVTWQWLFPLATLLVLGGLWSWRRRDRAPLAAALLFGGALFPVLGFVNVYPFIFSYVADHFQYLASLGMIAFLTAAAIRGHALLPWPKWSGPAIAAGVCLVLGGLTWRQAGTYRDLLTLYQGTLERNPESWVAHLNLGTVLAEGGQPEQSLPHLQRALELKPDSPETLNSLADVLNQLGRSTEAVPLLERALQRQPRFAEAHNTLGVALMATGRAQEGVTEFKRAMEISPQLVLARVNLGWALANRGQVTEALALFEQAQRLRPDLADIEYKWGHALGLAGRIGEAIPHFQRAVELAQGDVTMRYVLGRTLLAVGRTAEAIAQLQETLRIDPNHAGARETLAGLRRAGMTVP